MHSQDPTYPLFPTFAFLGFLVSLIPLPWHLQAWNAGTCAYMVWAGLSCLIEFVNALVWKGNVFNVTPVWCDISSKFLLGASVGIPASTLCLSRRLYTIASVQTASVTRKDKRRAVVCDLCIAVGIPCLVMALHYIVQPHRFDILEDIGCYGAIYNTLPAYFLFFMWPVLIGCISSVYSTLTLRCFWQRRAQFAQLFSSNNSALTRSRYLRLMMLSMIDMICTIPLGVYGMYIGTKGVGLAPWISWADTHFNFSRVEQIPTVIWRSDPSGQISVELTRWIYVFSALLFFALFGFANEALKNYSLVFWWIATRFGCKPRSKKNVNSSLPNSQGFNKQANAYKLDPVSPSGGSLHAYAQSPGVPRYIQKHRPESLSSSLAGDSDLDVDIEKSAGTLPSISSTSVTPEYYSSHITSESDEVYGHEKESSPRLSTPIPSMILNAISIPISRGRDSDRRYISDVRTRTPSPAPFSDVIPSYHRPFTPPSVYPVVLPHPSIRSLTDVDSVRVTVHTQSVE